MKPRISVHFCGGILFRLGLCGTLLIREVPKVLPLFRRISNLVRPKAAPLMLPRPEVSHSDTSNPNRESTASSVRSLRSKIFNRLRNASVSMTITCLVCCGRPTAVIGQDVKPPVIETANSNTGKPIAADPDSSVGNSQQEASQILPAVKAASSKTTPRKINLLEKGLAESWNYFSSDGTTEMADAWILKTVDEQQQLICRGKPKGFLYTKAQHSNFRLTFEWKYITDPDSNSGVLIYTQKEPRLWPTAMQVQLHQPLAGCIFPGGDATSDNSTEPKGMAREIGEWNSCLIVSEGGKLSVEINGRKAGEVSGCKPSTGFIALQAEGYETHFRKLMLQVLPPPEATPAVTVEAPAATEKTEEAPQEASQTESKSDGESKAKPLGFDG